MALTNLKPTTESTEKTGVYVGIKLPIADADEFATLVGGKLSQGGAQLARTGITKATGVEFEAPTRGEGDAETLYLGVKVSNEKAKEICDKLGISPETGGTNIMKHVIGKLLGTRA